MLIAACGGDGDSRPPRDDVPDSPLVDAADTTPDDAPVDDARDVSPTDTVPPDIGPGDDTTPDAPEDDADTPPGVAFSAGPERVLVGAEATFALTLAGDPERVEVAFGAGPVRTLPSGISTFSNTWDRAGRYRVVVTAIARDGRRASASRLVLVHHPAVEGIASATPVLRQGDRIAVAVPDSGELVVVADDRDAQFPVVERHEMCPGIGTIAAIGAGWVATCPASDRLAFASGTDPARWLQLPWGSRPWGVIVDGERLLVTLQGRAALLVVDPADSPVGWAPGNRIPTFPDARGLARLSDGSVLVSRWRSSLGGGELLHIPAAALDGAEIASRPVALAFDDQTASDTESGGVPTWLSSVAVAPDGRAAAIPSMQANAGDGLFLNGTDLTFETTIRAVVSWIDLERVPVAEATTRRKQFDNRGLASAAAWTSTSDYLWVAMPGARSIDRVDAFNGAVSGTLLDVGWAPTALALSADDARLFVHATLSRELVVYDVTDWTTKPQPIARVRLVEREPLAPTVLRGKRLFNDAFDDRLSKDGYVACAHCHLDGDGDNLVWDFTGRGEGLRNTIPLLGRAGTGDGPVHWTANFDEIHDFEHDIRGPFGGKGLMTDDAFASGTRNTPLGDPKAGASEDLDALADYVATLRNDWRSPWRDDDGTLTESAERGRVLFFSETTGCASCHSGNRLTDSGIGDDGQPVRHDVGTAGPGSGGRLGIAGNTAFDTPTLHGLWYSAPYLHDGSAVTLHDVLTTRNIGDRHGVTSHLDADQRDDLVHWLLSQDGSQP